MSNKLRRSIPILVRIVIKYNLEFLFASLRICLTILWFDHQFKQLSTGCLAVSWLCRGLEEDPNCHFKMKGHKACYELEMVGTPVSTVA